MLSYTCNVVIFSLLRVISCVLSGSLSKSGPLNFGTKNNFPSFAELPSVIGKVKFIDFVKRATSPKMQLAEFRFHTNPKVHSLL